MTLPPPSDGAALPRPERLRSLFEGWKGVPHDPSVAYENDWKSSVDWASYAEDEIDEQIRLRSVPVIEQRLRRLWSAIGETVADDPVAARVHASVTVSSLHNGIPLETFYEARHDGGNILVNDAIADFTRHVFLGYTSWTYSRVNTSSSTEARAWGEAFPVVRRILAFENWSIAFGGLVQPFEFDPPGGILAHSVHAAEWSLVFWLAHEFGHALRAAVATGEQVEIAGRDASALLREADGEEAEHLCDLIALRIALTTPHPEFEGSALTSPLALVFAFLPLVIAEHRHFVRPPRGGASFLRRWSALQALLDRSAPDEDAGEAFRDAIEFLETICFADSTWSDGALLTLVDECVFAAPTPTQTPTDLHWVSARDDEVRLYLTPSSLVSRSAEILLQEGATPDTRDGWIRAVLDRSAGVEVPAYDETFLSRDYHLAVDHFRLRFRAALAGADDLSAVINPRGDVTFSEWTDSWSFLGDPVFRRIAYEIASDPWPLIVHDVRDARQPPAPPSALRALRGAEAGDVTSDRRKAPGD